MNLLILNTHLFPAPRKFKKERKKKKTEGKKEVKKGVKLRNNIIKSQNI